MLRASPCLRAGVVHDQPGFPATPRRWSGDPHGAGDDVRRRYAAGDADAVRAVYAQYAGPMLTAALHVLGGDRRLAEEAVQLAMLKAWRAAASFDPTRPLSPWLYAIVRRCAIDIARKEQRHRVLPLDHPAVEPAASEGDGLESATSAWAVREALGTLPATEYTVVRLSYYEGLDSRRDRPSADDPDRDGEVTLGECAPAAARRARPPHSRPPGDRGPPRPA